MAQLVKNMPGFDPRVGKFPCRREKLPTPVFWPGEFHGLYSPWGCKESDTAERLSLHFPFRVLGVCVEYGDSHGPSPWGLEVWFGWGSSAWPACGGAGSSGCYCYSCCCCCLGAQKLKPLLSGPLWMSSGFSEPPQRPLDPGMG